VVVLHRGKMVPLAGETKEASKGGKGRQINTREISDSEVLYWY